MGEFGERLRREREMRGISLDEIVATTKIGTRLLRALEDEQFDLLPGGIFNKAYVRAYAKCVGINEDEAVAAYLEAANERPPDTRVIAHQHASIYSERPAQRNGGFPIVPVFILLVVIAGGWGGWKIYQDRQHDREPRATSDSPEPVSSGNSAANNSSALQTNAAVAPPTTASAMLSPSKRNEGPIPSSSTNGAAQNPASAPATATAASNGAAGTSFEVIIRATGPAWVAVESDGRGVVRGVIKPPDVKTIRATNQVVFHTGNAGAVAVSFNGKSIPLPGGRNQEGMLVFDSRGVVQQPSVAAQ